MLGLLPRTIQSRVVHCAGSDEEAPVPLVSPDDPKWSFLEPSSRPQLLALSRLEETDADVRRLFSQARDRRRENCWFRLRIQWLGIGGGVLAAAEGDQGTGKDGINVNDCSSTTNSTTLRDSTAVAPSANDCSRTTHSTTLWDSTTAAPAAKESGSTSAILGGSKASASRALDRLTAAASVTAAASGPVRKNSARKLQSRLSTASLSAASPTRVKKGSEKKTKSMKKTAKSQDPAKTTDLKEADLIKKINFLGHETRCVCVQAASCTRKKGVAVFGGQSTAAFVAAWGCFACHVLSDEQINFLFRNEEGGKTAGKRSFHALDFLNYVGKGPYFLTGQRCREHEDSFLHKKAKEADWSIADLKDQRQKDVLWKVRWSLVRGLNHLSCRWARSDSYWLHASSEMYQTVLAAATTTSAKPIIIKATSTTATPTSQKTAHS